MGAYKRSELIESFFARVQKTDSCWLWIGGQSKGYGQLKIDKKRVYAHRFSFEYHNDMILLPSQLLLHSCDNPACVNPQHLRIGSHLDNTTDMIERGRFPNKRHDRYYFDPNGQLIKIENMREFFRDNNLNRIALMDVEKGARKSYKGYTKYHGFR